MNIFGSSRILFCVRYHFFFADVARHVLDAPQIGNEAYFFFYRKFKQK